MSITLRPALIRKGTKNGPHKLACMTAATDGRRREKRVLVNECILEMTYKEKGLAAVCSPSTFLIYIGPLTISRRDDKRCRLQLWCILEAHTLTRCHRDWSSPPSNLFSIVFVCSWHRNHIPTRLGLVLWALYHPVFWAEVNHLLDLA